MDKEPWPAEWMRGVLELWVLAVVAGAGAEGTHGYGIAKRLATEGLGRVKGGTLYPLLARLEQDGLVASAWTAGVSGPGRKQFVVTGAGVEHLRSRARAWQAFVRLSEDLISSGVEGARDPGRTGAET